MKLIDYLHSLNSEQTAKLIKKNICDNVSCTRCPLWYNCKDKMTLSWEDELEEEYELPV